MRLVHSFWNTFLVSWCGVDQIHNLEAAVHSPFFPSMTTDRNELPWLESQRAPIKVSSQRHGRSVGHKCEWLGLKASNWLTPVMPRDESPTRVAWDENLLKYLFYSHHGDIYSHRWDILELGVVTDQLQVLALAQLWNDTQHWRRQEDKVTEERHRFGTCQAQVHAQTFRGSW